MINWETVNVTEEETLTINEIAKRAVSQGVQRNFLHLNMDIMACHVSGCRLDLKALLAFPRRDFLHDICGIVRHIDCETGVLEDGFLPRCAVANAG